MKLSRSGRFVPWDIDVAGHNFGANCGPVSFATVSRCEVCRVMRYFHGFEERRWTNLTQMRRAFAESGAQVETLKRTWPAQGVALIQWLGPWTERDFFGGWTLVHTHWVAVDGNLVFDHSVRCWLDRAEWVATIVPTYLAEIPRASGWAVKYGLQANNSICRGSDHETSVVGRAGSFSFSG